MSANFSDSFLNDINSFFETGFEENIKNTNFVILDLIFKPLKSPQFHPRISIFLFYGFLMQS